MNRAIFPPGPKRRNAVVPLRAWTGEKELALQLETGLRDPVALPGIVDFKRTDRLSCVYLKKIFARLCRGKVLETVTEGEQ